MSYRISGRKSSLLIITTPPPHSSWHRNSGTTLSPGCHVSPWGNPEGRDRMNGSSPHKAGARALLNPTTMPSTGRPGQGEEQHPALENATPIKLRRLGSRSAESGVVVLRRRIHTQHSRDGSAPQRWIQFFFKKSPERIFITNVSIFIKLKKKERKKQQKNKSTRESGTNCLESIEEKKKRLQAVKYTVIDESD